MKQIKLIPVEHRGNNQLLVKFAINNELVSILRKIPDAKWSRTHTSWYVANNPENLKLIYSLFKGVAEIETDYRSQPDYKNLKDFCNLDSMQSEGSGRGSGSLSDFAALREPLNSPVIIEISGKLISLKFSNKENDADVKFLETLEYCVFNSNLGVWQITDYRNNLELIKQYFGTRITEKEINPKSQIPNPKFQEEKKEHAYSLMVTPKKLFLKIPKNDEDIAFINTLKYSRWKKEIFRWEIPNYKNNVELIMKHFGQRLTEVIDNCKLLEVGSQQQAIGSAEKPRKQKPNTVEIEIINNKHIVVFFPFSFEHVKKMKTLPLYYFQHEDKSWKFPYTENIINEIERYFKTFNYAIEIKQVTVEDSRQKEKKNYGNERKIPLEYVEKMTLLRMSENTIRVYTHAFTDFINYYSSKNLQEITYDDIKNYLLYMIEKRKISASFQNQIINAVKFYYEQVLDQKKLPYIDIERPTKPKQLPNILSVEEIKTMIGTIKNLKHKAIIMTIYSAGLRISECINLRIADIDSNRKSIFVKSGKGNKDRYTLLSEKLLPILRNYIKECKPKPKELLFEGPNGSHYSETSIHKILEKACKDAKIIKVVTTRTLRHSFATHLHEAGVDIKYIKELLGHSSLKTTEIYTHLTFKAMGEIKSPLDNIDF